MPSISPYLFFDGNCREAMTAYAEILGGELLAMMSFAEAPEIEGFPKVPEDLIMHAAVGFAGHMIMGCDDMPGRNVRPASTYVSVSLQETAQARQVFDRLSEGGEVLMAFDKAFFADGFGSLRDRWGQLWMVSTDTGMG
ncbi:VOC family protein [Tropicimonas sp.]|uniref:VOC family protein n=1 Tax=Tropicimonas sp. TaxID=2067044 RepID=UPI003A853EC1